MIFTIWESEICGITLKEGGSLPMIGNTVEDTEAIKILEFEAASWNEACQIQNDHYGWGKYIPMDDSEST